MREPVLSDSETEANKEHRAELLRLIASKEAIAFVGAGLSQRVGYPGWRELVAQLAELAGSFGLFVPPPGLSPGKAPQFVHAIKEHIVRTTGDLRPYWNFLGREFGHRSPGCSRIHHDLIQLPFKGFITSNYDPCLENACSAAIPGQTPIPVTIDPARAYLISQFLVSLDAKEAPHRIAHLHGYYQGPSSIVLAADDYQEAYGLRGQATDDPLCTSSLWPLHRRLVWALLATRRLVFFGFGLEDADFRVMLESVASDLWNWRQSIHYVLIGIGPDHPEEIKAWGEDLWRKYGVRVVFYEDLDGSHAGLDQFVLDALAFCKTGDKGGYLKALNLRTRRAMRYED
jgi:hypothetical protein